MVELVVCQSKRFFSRTFAPSTTNNETTSKVPIMEKLDRGELILGDGGITYTLEKRGYITATQWTPEAVVEHPEAGYFFLLFMIHALNLKSLINRHHIVTKKKYSVF